MNQRRIVAIGTTALALIAAAAFAQPGRGQGMGMPRYDKATETTLQGTVQEVQTHEGRMGGTGTHLLLNTGAGIVDVHVGPTNWLTGKKYGFAEGDSLEVVGSKIKLNGADAIIAREITKGDTKMVLRNENGIPAWSGGGRGVPGSDGTGCGCGRPMRR